jgi:hypothetical protein
MFLPNWTLRTPLMHSGAIPEAPRLDDRLARLPEGALANRPDEGRADRGLLSPLPDPEPGER